MQQVSQFAVFGFNQVEQDIIDSDIFVTINYSVLSGALICLQCDINIKTSQLQFVAHGVQISALILKSINTVQISKVTISFRFQSNFSSGIINQVNQSIDSFSISESSIAGFNYNQSTSNGYICSQMFVDFQVEINSLQVCVENTSRFGTSLFSASISEQEIINCANICNNLNYVTYGLCQQQPEFSTLLQNSTVICEHPFVFNHELNSCECDFGFFLNVSFCVNVINQFSITQKNATDLEYSLRTEIQTVEIDLKTAFIGLEQLIMSNISDLVVIVSENDKILNNSIISTNETIHKNINELRTDNLNQHKTIIEQIETKHTQVTNQINSKFSAQNTLIEARFSTVDLSEKTINSKLDDMKTQITGVQTAVNLRATQSYLTDVYNALSGQISALKTITNPCAAWPGSINENGLCKCVYKGATLFCPNLNQCCQFGDVQSRLITWQNIKYSIQASCGNGQIYSSSEFGSEAEAKSNLCGASRYYTNQ
ncbi:Hypothetical_protein [Hexamita inflata]|uniref:Hypothetical_protein n=1 Tax=Hexamita inflata TaxID=28002 RepID=A0AA86NAP6_9EUKA|nr:Hypothetical protein HINF_LOCUS3381 [Hexamita inflata]